MRERVHQSKPFLWIAIAGYEGAKAKIMDNKKLQNFLPDCYLTELSMPLRSTKAVLAMSNLKSGKTANPLLVSGSLYSSVNFTVPPQPLNGVLGPQFTIKKADDRAEVESVVKQAREALRLGDKTILSGSTMVLNLPELSKEYLHSNQQSHRCLPTQTTILVSARHLSQRLPSGWKAWEVRRRRET